MIGDETLLEYCLHYLVPVVVSAIVAIFCFWLGVYREKRKDQEKRKVEIRKQKEKFVMDLWEIYTYAGLNKKAILEREEISKKKRNFDKIFLNMLSLDFYNIAKDNNFFDFDFKLKADLLFLKTLIIATNTFVQQYNSIYGSYNKINEIVSRLSSLEEQIIKSSNSILDIYTKICTTEQLVVLTLECLELRETVEKKLKEREEKNYGKER